MRPLHLLNPKQDGTTACGKRSVRVRWTQYQADFMSAAHRCAECRAFVRGPEAAQAGAADSIERREP